MKDRRSVAELTLEELEEVLRVRRREERIKRMGKKLDARDPLGDGRPEDEVPSPSYARRPVNAGSPSAERRYSAIIKPRHSPRHFTIRWKWVRDQTLLFVEVLALVGFFLVIGQLMLMVQGINEESRAAQAVPTPTATPLISVAVLPGGHTPPDAQGYSEPAAIPAHLQSLVSAVTPLPVPTPGPDQAQRIVIASIGVDAPVVEGDDWESLKKGAAHHIGSANPGERGNCVISAHNDIYGEIFRDLPEVQVGQDIEIYTQSQVYRYVVQQTRIIEPTEVGVMSATSSPVLTLISCYPYGVDTHRIVVIATLKR
ncbi:MAG: sortase [Anaerolineae bacterium]|nr:sortase [Anaerolineae bacterium]